MNLTDIAPLERWMELENDINARSGMDANVFDTKGYRISPQKHWANRLCPAIKDTDKGQSFICAPAHMNIAAQAMRSRATVIEECDAGMIKLVVPIFMGGESTPSRAVVQSAGRGFRIPSSVLREEFKFAPVLHLLLRFTQALIAQMVQTAACNKHLTLE